MFCICPIDLLLIYGTDLDVNPDADVQKSVKAWKEQCIAVTELVLQPFKTMVTIAMCLGLRVSEILGLRWGDFDWEGLAISIQRAYVLGAEDQVKTMYSERQMPLDPALAEILFRYRRTYAPEATADDWVFSNPTPVVRGGRIASSSAISERLESKWWEWTASGGTPSVTPTLRCFATWVSM